MKAKRRKLPENKTTTLTISVLPEEKQELIDFIGNGNLSAFVREGWKQLIKKSKKFIKE
jgi:hypothetical protein